jgi:hypothetical protein
MTEYLREAKVPIESKLATALFYGIAAETQDLGREATPAPFAARFRPLQSLAQSPIEVVNTYRHQAFVVAQPTNIVTAQALHVRDALGRSQPDAEVFAVDRSGPRGGINTLFLGFTSVNGVLSLAAKPAGMDLVVIGPGGDVGFCQPSAVDPQVLITLRPAGRVLLGPTLRPAPTSMYQVVAIRFVPVEPGLPGMEHPAVRFASSDTGWEVSSLWPGTYRAEVGGNTYVVEVPSGGSVVLP